jgi:diguanylate cyclase (GGDEF)-like protein
MTARIESLAEVLATEARLINTLVHRLADVREGAAHPGDTEADLTETLNASVERARSASIRLASFVHREVARYQAATRQQLEETRAATDRMQILLLVLGGVVVFIALPFFWVYLGGQVVQRIDDLAAMARRLAAGDLSGGLPPRTRDELGDLAEGLIMARGAMIELQQSNEKLQQKSAELLTMAITDPLTGVANRRRFTEFAQIELDRSQRYNHPLSLVLMDLDHFKSINDRFGHDMGDRVLIHTATLLSQEIRGTDLVARYGGEEFILLLPEEPLDGALKLADRLRSLTEAQRLTTPDGGVVRWSISVGVVSMKRTDGGLHDLIRRADAALYRAKAAGRNHVEADS